MRFLAYLGLALIGFFWLFSLPVAVLGIGFSGYEILSLARLYADLRAGDSYALNRLWAWFELLFPFVVAAVFIWQGRRRRRMPKAPDL